MVGIPLGLIVALIAFDSLFTGVLKITNPQYYAIEKAVEQAKKNIK